MTTINTFEISETKAYIFIFVSGLIGVLFALYNWFMIIRIDTSENSDGLLSQHKEQVIIMNTTARHIQEGANTFLLQEYLYLSVFVIIFFIAIICCDDFKFYTASAFVVGAAASVASGYFGMYVATRTNVRVTFQAAVIPNEAESYKGAFNAAFRGGCVMGFFLVSLALVFLAFIIIIFKSIKADLLNPEDYMSLFEGVSGYGLGGSTVALFCRVGGGIYTKAADVGADLIGKNEFGLGEDSPDNPATIADNVGDNVGDIAGMGSDLFGSFAESTCAALMVSASSQELIKGGNYLYPLLISAGGILVCLVTTFFATTIFPVTEKPKIEKALRWQLILSSLLLTPLIVLLSLFTLPAEFRFREVEGLCTNKNVMICGLTGLWCGMIIGYMTDIFTSTEYSPVQNLARSCKSGAAINIIQGLALGYLSATIPIISLASKFLLII